MNIGDFELLVCRTAGVAPVELDRGALEAVVRCRATATGCRTLCEYADLVEVSGAELTALVDAALGSALRMLPAAPSADDVVVSLAPIASHPLDSRYMHGPRSPSGTRNAPSADATAPARAQPTDATPARKLLAGHLASTATPDTRALILLGLLRERDGNPEDALACYRLAERRAPADARAWRALLTVLIAGTEAAQRPDVETPAQRRA